jgi:hypothetical protein
MKEGYQLIKNDKDSYTWEDVDKAWWEGFDNCKEKIAGKLIRAKELLRDLLDTPCFYTQGDGEICENEGYTELVEEIEEFLKENE